MFDELFCWGMHVFDLLWADQKGKRVEMVMGLLKEKMSQKLRQPPVHGGFEMLFFEENKVLKTRIAKINDSVKLKEVGVSAVWWRWCGDGNEERERKMGERGKGHEGDREFSPKDKIIWFFFNFTFFFEK